MKSVENQRPAEKPQGRPTESLPKGPGIDAEDRHDSAAAAAALELMKAVEHPGEFSPPPRPIPGKPE